MLTTESVAIEVARSSVGGIALALSVPLTSGIAAILATPHISRASGPAAPAGTVRAPT